VRAGLPLGAVSVDRNLVSAGVSVVVRQGSYPAMVPPDEGGLIIVDHGVGIIRLQTALLLSADPLARPTELAVNGDSPAS
jgi:hypothetical protein